MNNFLLLAISIVSAGFVLVAWRLGKERLYSVIIVFLILIATAGGKIVEFFGYETNTGNIFYASVFLATYFLIERYGKEEGIRSIWIGIIGVAFFTILAGLSALQIGSESTTQVNNALSVVLGSAPRLAFASLLAYGISQSVNVYLYIYLKQKFNGARLWLRANLANAAAQAVDSIIFFVVAFGGTIAPANIGEVILMGLVIKIVFMMAASTLLFLNKVEQEEGGGFSSILMR